MFISCSRAFFYRIAAPGQFTNQCVLRNLTKQFQGYHSYNRPSYASKQSRSVSIRFPMGWDKKRKSSNSVWRPISTHSTSNEDNSLDDIMAEPENVPSTEQGEHEKCVVSLVTAVADSSISQLPLEAEKEVVEAEGVQINSGTAGVSGLKDAEGASGDSMTASALHDSFGETDAEKNPIAYKNKHVVSVVVGASVMRFIRGKDKSVQRYIEEEMGVKLLFPSSKNEDSIVIEAESMDAITKASEKIQAIVDEAVKSPALNYSHFISLPLAIHTELVDKLTKFQSTILGGSESKDGDGTMGVDSSDETLEDEEISDKAEKAPDVAVQLKVDDTNNVKMDIKNIPLVSDASKTKSPTLSAPDVAVQLKVDDTNNVKMDIKNIPLVSYASKTKSPTLSDLGIDKSIFIKPKTFHLTVLMLKLWNKERVHAAKEVLQGVYSDVMKVLDNRPLFVRLKGLDCLRGSRDKAQVLYAPIEEIGNEGRLLRACQIIIDAYVKAGLVLEKDSRQKLKLHATVMNTTHRKGRNRRRKDTFDARGIFEQFGTEQWGDYHIREAHLSQRFLYDENGYYHCCGSIPFPEISEVPESSTAQLESIEASIAESV